MVRSSLLIVATGLLLPSLAVAQGESPAQRVPSPTVVVVHDTPEQRDQRLHAHRFAQFRFGVDALTFTGTRLVGTGSRERYRGAGANLELLFTRFFTKKLGLEFALMGAPFSNDRRPDDPPGWFVRLEAGLDLATASWSGRLPGSLLLGLGGGIDDGRYWYAPRFYPYAMARLRLWPMRDVSMQLQYTLVPVSVGAPILATIEQRVEIATSISLFQFGLQLSYVDATGGTPSRSYFQAGMGGFVGMVLM